MKILDPFINYGVSITLVSVVIRGVNLYLLFFILKGKDKEDPYI